MYSTIKKIAKSKGMSVSEVERNAKLGRSSICKWDTSSPTLDSLEKVASAMDIDVTDLITMARREGEDEAVAAEDNPNER